jgi:methyltransferase OMS1
MFVNIGKRSRSTIIEMTTTQKLLVKKWPLGFHNNFNNNNHCYYSILSNNLKKKLPPKPPKFQFITKKELTPEEEKQREDEIKYHEAINSGSFVKKWGAILGSTGFNKKATKYYLGLYIIFLCYGIYYFKKLFTRHLEEEDLKKLRDSGIELTEYQKLRIRDLSNDLLRTKDTQKLKAYYKLKKDYDSKSDEERKELGDFNPKPEDISNIVDISFENCILPPKDLSSFYDKLAEDYDSDVGTEEAMSFMKSKRKWVMKHCKGDVLEVASGTGRNIDYIDPTVIKSYTFLDASKKMMDICYDKFHEKWDKFKKVKFVVGKAEELVELSTNTNTNKNSKLFKYDTIIETFGLCSHEDPIKALKNMRELLKPGGRIILLEHGRGEYNFINEILDKRAHKHSEKWGCRWNLDIGEIVDESGLEITEEKRSHLGTTWMIVCKRPEDVLDIEEMSFTEKYFFPKRTNLDSSNIVNRDDSKPQK